MKLWRSGVILSAAGFIGGLGNYAFQMIMGRQLSKEEFGYVISTLGFVNLMGLPLVIVATSLVHYIAQFKATNDEARLQGLLKGSQRFLLKAIIVASVLALVLAGPLSRYFEFQRESLMAAALVCVLFGIWSGFATALAQGMSWFKRMAVVGLAAVPLRLLFGWIATKHFPTAEAAVSATTFSLLSSFALLYWWKDLFKRGGETISPWNREFLWHLVFSAAFVGGTFCFAQGDLLVAKKYFEKDTLGNYNAAGLLGRAPTQLVGPILAVLFTSRSGSKIGAAAKDQRIMLALYAGGLICGAIGLIVLRQLLVKFIFSRYTPAAAALVSPFAIAMVFVGMVQAIGTFCLASRWFKLSLLYGFLGVGYWVTILSFGKSPEVLLSTMTIAGEIAFVIMLVGWFITTRNVKNPS